MRILVIEPYGTRLGHFGLYATHIGHEFGRLGHEVTVLTGTHLRTEEYLQSQPRFRLIEVGLSEHCLPSGPCWLRKLLSRIMHGPNVIRINLAALRAALRLHEREKFEVIHSLAVEPLSTVLLLLWSEWMQHVRLAPLVIQVFPTDFSALGHGTNVLRAAYKVASRFALRVIINRYCRAVSVQGEWHRKRLLRQLGFNGAKGPNFFVIRPGTYLPDPEISRTVARESLGLDPQATVFLFFGMLRKDKGIEVLLEAVTGLSGNWQLLVAGAAFEWTPASLAERVARCGQPERVRTDLRYIPEGEVGTYFAAADAVVMPYRGKHYLGNYGPLILACGYGKPVIASDVGEMGDLVRRHSLGYAVRPDDPAALQEALQSFLRLPQIERERMGAHARSLAQECSFASMARRLGALYAEFVAEQVPPDRGGKECPTH